jgi:hypothetical protein
MKGTLSMTARTTADLVTAFKLFKVREYFDLLTLLEPGTPRKLYS